MSAIDYANSQDWLAYLNGKKKTQDKIPTTNVFGGFPFSAPSFAAGGKMKRKKRGKMAEDRLIEEPGMPLFAYGGSLKTVSTSMVEPVGVFDNGKDTLFALGGVLQSHGSDWGNGATHIDAGGSHEENVNDGVQLGVDQNGTPNLVEEGEVVFNDYVYSKRIYLDEEAKKAFHISKNRDITYADMAKKLEKESEERPNDPISASALKAQMQDLADQQERQKQEMEAERAEEAFNALSDEEKVALMQQAAEQEQMAQEQAMAEEQAAMQQPSPEEMAAMEQQAAMGQQMSPEEAAMMQQSQTPTEQMPPMEQQPVVAAYGGKVNKFDEGGYTKLFKALGINTLPDFVRWAKKNKVLTENEWKDYKYWDTVNSPDDLMMSLILTDDNFKKAIAEENPRLADAMERGYFDTPKSSTKATIQSIANGNWKDPSGKGWNKSTDDAFLQATKGLSQEEIDDLTSEQLAARMKQTDAYKNTSKWLENADNALLYLNTLYNDDATPEEAKKYAERFIENGKWKDGFNYDYATVFGSNGRGVRETDPGTYWHSVKEATRDNIAKNLVWDDELKKYVDVVGDVPADWKNEGSYSWAGADNDNTVTYYRRPVPQTAEEAAAAAGDAAKAEAAKKAAEEAVEMEPDLKTETNYGMWGPAVGLGLWAAGVGRPDTSGLDAIMANAARAYHTASNKYLGNYMKYKPLDTWFNQAKIDAQARATDRAIRNSGVNQGSMIAGFLQNGLNSQLASGEALRADNKYNREDEFKTGEFNRGTDMFNAQAYNQLSQFNTEQANRAGQSYAQLGLNAAAQKMDADAGWYNSLYGNIGNLFENVKQWEKWKRDHNTVAKMAADDLFGTMSDQQKIGKGFLRTKKKKSLTV